MYAILVTVELSSIFQGVSLRTANHSIPFLVVLSAVLAGCGTDDITHSPSSQSPPTAAFSATERHGSLPLDVQFIDESVPGDEPITSWAWAFGDGGSSTDQNPVHTFTSSGCKTVSLTVTTLSGTHTETRTCYIDPLACDVPYTNVDFGKVGLFDCDDRRFAITNTSNEIVDGFISSPCSDFTIVQGDGPYSLQPGQRHDVVVRFSPTFAGRRDCAVATGCEDVMLSGTGVEEPDVVRLGLSANWTADDWNRDVCTWDRWQTHHAVMGWFECYDEDPFDRVFANAWYLYGLGNGGTARLELGKAFEAKQPCDSPGNTAAATIRATVDFTGRLWFDPGSGPVSIGGFAGAVLQIRVVDLDDDGRGEHAEIFRHRLEQGDERFEGTSTVEIADYSFQAGHNYQVILDTVVEAQAPGSTGNGIGSWIGEFYVRLNRVEIDF